MRVAHTPEGVTPAVAGSPAATPGSPRAEGEPGPHHAGPHGRPITRHSPFFMLWTVVSAGLVATLIPLGLFLLPFTPRLRARRTTSTTKGVVSELFTTLPDAIFCTRTPPTYNKWRPNNVQPASPVYARSTSLLRRPVVCILQGRHFRKTDFYAVSAVPWTFCTVIVYSAHGVEPPFRLGDFENDYAARLATSAHGTFVTQGRKQIPVLLGFGGDDSQHPKLSALAHDPARMGAELRKLVRTLIEPNHFAGVHVEWRYPGARCGTAADKDNLLALLGQLKAIKPGIILSVVLPNDDNAIQRGYNLPDIFNAVDYVIASSAAERLDRQGTPQDTVYCRNNRTEATLFALRIRQRIPRSEWHKLCYTVQLSATTFIADTPKLGSKSLGRAPGQAITATPGKAGYFELCHYSWSLHLPQHPECSIVFKADPFTGRTLVAAFENADNLDQRFAASVGSDIGNDCVAVEDVEFDDVFDKCGHGASARLQTVAQGGGGGARPYDGSLLPL